MPAEVRASAVHGTVTPPASKSQTHRLLLVGALAGGVQIDGPLDSRDTRATAAVIDDLGGAVRWGDDRAIVEGFPGGDPSPADGPIDCANSGTTLRLGCGLAALADGRSTLTGDASLRRRPNGPLLRAIRDLGGEATSGTRDGTAPVHVAGPMEGGSVTLPGDVSSQFVSSLLLAGAHTARGVDVTLDSPLISRPYVAMTNEVLAQFTVNAGATEAGYRVAGEQAFTAPSEAVPVGIDPTAASYLLAAGVLAGDPSITVTDVGERAGRPAPIIDVLHSLSIDLTHAPEGWVAARARPEPGTVDLAESPDLLPTVAVLAATADGTSHLVNCHHARFKETDRITATAQALRTLGVPVSEREDGVTVRGQPAGLAGGTIDSRGDHRIAMAMALAGLVTDDGVRIRNHGCVEVSYPGYFETLRSLGADVALPG